MYSKLWNGDRRPILASKSATRRALLEAAGLDCEIVVQEIDERAVEANFLASGGNVDALAVVLARAKALAVSEVQMGRYCLGADQVLILDGGVFHKPSTRDEARRHIARLSGRTHILSSAFAIARDGMIFHQDVDCAGLTMRSLSEAQIELYLDIAGDAVFASVGGYQLESLGVHLFERVDGDYTTILGLPMFKLLSWLRRYDMLLL